MSFEAVTGVGGTAAVSFAAFRAGLTRTVRVPYGSRSEAAWSHAVRVEMLAERNVEARCGALLQAVLADAARLSSPGQGLRVAAWSVGPRRCEAVLARRLGLEPALVKHAAEHGSAALGAVRDAWSAIESGKLDLAVVAGACVHSDDASLAAGRRSGRVLGGESSFGTVPGEAAAALVWASERARQLLGLSSLGRLLSVAVAQEPVPFRTATPCVGEGLSEAVRTAARALPNGRRVQRVFCDLNGERQRTDEWGFALPRVSAYLEQPGAFVTPISAFGDVGAASGLLLLGLSSHFARRSPSVQHCLIWTSSEGSERAAACFELPAARLELPADGPLPWAHGSAPAWARALDRSVLAEMAEECSFRYDQRSFEYERRLPGNPTADWQAIARIEAVLDTLVEGLADVGHAGWSAVTAPLAQATPGALYAALRVLFQAGQDALASPIVTSHAGRATRTDLALEQALEHMGLERERAAPLVAAWLHADPPLIGPALGLAARSGVDVSQATLQQLASSLSDADVAATLALVRGLGRLRKPENRALLGRWQRSPHAAVRREWALAELSLGGRTGRANVLAWSEQDPAVVLPASLVVGAEHAPRFRLLARDLGGNDACLALGLLGDPDAVELLLDRLGDGATAPAAACALELLLGQAPHTTYHETDVDERAPPVERIRIAVAPDAWQQLARAILLQHPPGLRLRGGTPATLAAALEMLQRPHLPLRVRRYLARELHLRWGVADAINVHALLRQQQAALDAARSAPASAPGAWD